MTFIKAFFNGEIRRIGIDNLSSFDELEHELQDLFNLEGTPLRIQYKDEEGDDVVMSSDKELKAALTTNGLLRLNLSALPKSGRGRSSSTGSSTEAEVLDKQRSLSVVDKPNLDGKPAPPTGAHQKMIFGNRSVKGIGKSQPQNHDTFARHNKSASGPLISPLKLGLSSTAAASSAAASSASNSSVPQPLSAKGKSPGLGLKLDLKAVKGDYEATPVPNLPVVNAGSDSDTEDGTDDASAEETGSGSDEEAEVEEPTKTTSARRPPARSFSAFLGFRQKSAKGLKQRDPGTIRIINHAPAAQLPCRVHSGLGDEFGIAPGTYWTFLLCESSTALELLKQIKEKLGCELVHIALFARNNSTPPKDTRIADDQLIFALKENWQKKNMDMKFAVKERPFGETVKDTGPQDELKRMQYKLQVTAQAPQGGSTNGGNISGRSNGAKSDVLNTSGDNFTLSSAAIKKPNKKFI